LAGEVVVFVAEVVCGFIGELLLLFNRKMMRRVGHDAQGAE